MLNFYLHRYVMSNVSYDEFKENVLNKVVASNKSDEEILLEVKEIIDTFNKGRWENGNI